MNINAGDLVVRDTGQRIGEPYLRIQAIELGGFYQGVGDGGGLAACLGADEQAIISSVSAAQYCAINANLIFMWLRYPRYSPEPSAEPVEACFLSVVIFNRPMQDDDGAVAGPVPAASAAEIEAAGDHRLRISGTHDPEALDQLIRGLSDMNPVDYLATN